MGLKSVFGKIGLVGLTIVDGIFPVPEIATDLARKGLEKLAGSDKADAGVAQFWIEMRTKLGEVIDFETIPDEDREAIEKLVRKNFAAKAELQKAIGWLVAQSAGVSALEPEA